MSGTNLNLNKVGRTSSLAAGSGEDEQQSSSLSVASEPVSSGHVSRHVSFNQDVSVKRIPKKKELRPSRSVPLNQRGGSGNNHNDDEFRAKCETFVNVPPPSDSEQIASEAEEILRQLEDIECSVSARPLTLQKFSGSSAGVASPVPSTANTLTRAVSPAAPVPRPQSATPTRFNRLFGGTLDRLSGQKGGGGLGLASRLSRSSNDLVRGLTQRPERAQAMRVEGHSEQEDSSSPEQSRFYGLEALNNLDNAVNGNTKPVNALHNNLHPDSSASVKKSNLIPAKPPRKAPSTSPPAFRRGGYISQDELQFGQSSEVDGPATRDEASSVADKIDRRSSVPSMPINNVKPLNFDPREAGAGGGKQSGYPTSGRSTVSPSRCLRQFSPLRSTGGGGNHTDSELLSSPTQVLYATISAGDKLTGGNGTGHHHQANKEDNYPGSLMRNNQYTVHSASQTVQSGLFRPVSVDRQLQTGTRFNSKENILDEPPSYQTPYGGKPMGPYPSRSSPVSRSLDRYIDLSDKENHRQREELRARIHVTSPTRFGTPDRQLKGGATNSRKPYKTTINTATDTIQYRGFSSENLHGGYADEDRHRGGGNFAHSGRRAALETEHYKVPRNKVPVPTAEFLSRQGRGRRTDSENSSSVYNNSSMHHQQQYHEGGHHGGTFASTSLVRNVEAANKRGISEYDREGRRIHSAEPRGYHHGHHSQPRTVRSGGGEMRHDRAYSGYSTSPDRDVSPERNYMYSKSRSGSSSKYNNNYAGGGRRSPSTSPTRPPRTRSAGAALGQGEAPVRREHSGRHVERTPSTRAAATSRSPIKKIQKINNEIQSDFRVERGVRATSDTSPTRRTLMRGSHPRDNSGGGSGARGTKNLLMATTTLPKDSSNSRKKLPKESTDDRLAKFTEYRGGGSEEEEENVGSASGGPPKVIVRRRRGSHSLGHEVIDVGQPPNHRLNVNGRNGRLPPEGERERGQSVPPGANIDSMRDFYKTSQYRSMYHLPPSPTRPAPVLDRNSASTMTKTLERGLRRERSGDALLTQHPPPRRISKTSMSEGEVTDDQSRQERHHRQQRGKFINNMMLSRQESGAGTRNGQSASGQREASGDRMHRSGSRVRVTQNGADTFRPRQHGSREKRPAPQPPTNRVRRSSIDILETSLSESESPRQDKAKSEGGSRWRGQGQASGQSDIDTDYRREMVSSVHSEARGRDGVSQAPIPTIYQQAAALSRREIEISQDDEEDEMVRSPTSLAREEERRKILQLEEDSRRKGVSRSNSRGNKILGLKTNKSSKLSSGLDTTEVESQYSGTSNTRRHNNENSGRRHPPDAGQQVRPGRHGQPSAADRAAAGRSTGSGPAGTTARVKRSGSSATTASSRHNGPISRRKMPGSVTSSVNSSESEHGSASVSRPSNASGQSNRSVYLHATAVADIPANPSRSASAGTAAAGTAPDPAATSAAAASNLKNSKKISRSISLLAPFKPKQNVKIVEREITYDNSGNIVAANNGNNGGGKPPRPPPTATVGRPLRSARTEKKFASSSDLLRSGGGVGGSGGSGSEDNHESAVMMSADEATRGLGGNGHASDDPKASKVSRSVSMPKDTRLAGWFKKRKRV